MERRAVAWRGIVLAVILSIVAIVVTFLATPSPVYSVAQVRSPLGAQGVARAHGAHPWPRLLSRWTSGMARRSRTGSCFGRTAHHDWTMAVAGVPA